MVTEHRASAVTIFSQASTPVDGDIPGGIVVGYLWYDTGNAIYKRCSSTGPIVFTNIEFTGGTITRKAVWFISGNLTVATEQGAKVEADGAWTLTDARAYAKTAPVGSTIIIDLNDDGTTVLSTKLVIADGANEDDGNHVISAASVADTSKLTLDIDQIGSGTAGADLTVELEFTRSVQ